MSMERETKDLADRSGSALKAISSDAVIPSRSDVSVVMYSERSDGESQSSRLRDFNQEKVID